MSTLLACADGNLTSSSTWALCDSTSENDSNSSQVTLSTSNSDSSTFTPGAITVDGIAVKIATRAASPSGTMTVTLRNSTDSTNVDSVTVNISDLPVSVDISNGFHSGWVFLKFGTNRTLTAAKAYLIRAVTSVNSQVTLLGSSTSNCSRQLRTTTTQAPASGDKMIVTAEWTAAATSTTRTVTMDNTASTTFGNVSFAESLSVCTGGTLTWGTSASTNYLLKLAGYLYLSPGGTMTIGTSSGTAMPSTSTGIIDFQVTSNVDSGIRIAGGTMETCGLTKTTITPITSTANSGQAVVNVGSVTGWANGDETVVTGTERNSSHYEQKAISSIATLAVTMTTNFSNKHSGSSSASVPNAVRGHVGIISHNVKIRGTSNSLRAFINVQTGSLKMRYTEMRWLGNIFSGAKQGLTWGTSFTLVDVQSCSFWNGAYIGTNANSFTSPWTVSSCVVYATDGDAIRVGDSNNSVAWTISSNLVVHSSGNFGFSIQHIAGATFNGNIATGHAVGFRFNWGTYVGIYRCFIAGSSFDGNEAYNNSQSGIQLDTSPPYLVISNFTAWRNGSYGILFNHFNNLNTTLDTCVCFGNGSQSLHLGVTTTGLVVKNCIFNGETSFGTANAIYAGTNVGYTEVRFLNCQFSQTVAHTTNDVGWNNTPLLNWIFIHCKVGATTVVQSMSGSTNFNIPMVGTVVKFQRYNQTAGDHRTFQVFCNTKTDTVIFHTASPSERITPRETSSLLKSYSAVRSKKANSGQAITISVWVRKSSSSDSGGANYNGNQPRLIQKANPAVGLNSDVVLATASASVGTWEQLSGTCSATSGDDGVIDFYVDCDGNAGWINLDDWTAS